MPKLVERQIALEPECKGVTSFSGKHYAADKNGVVAVPAVTAAALEASGALKRASRSFGQIGASWQPDSKLNLWREPAIA